MKKALKLLGIIAITAVISFSMAACGGDDDGPGGGSNAPTGLTAWAISSSEINLTWNPVPGAIGYNVYNSIGSPSAFTFRGYTSEPSGRNYDLQPNTTVFFQVSAIFPDGTESARSNTASATTLPSGSTGGGTAPTIITTSLPNGTVGTAYSQTLSAAGDTPITWRVNSGSLPAGLSLNASTGTISGTPTTAGPSTFTVNATNSKGTDAKQLSITITASGGGGNVAVTGVTVNPTRLDLALNTTGTLNATVQPNNATNQAVNWNTSNSSVATVSSGVVTAVGVGTATITVTTVEGGKNAYCTVTVTGGGGAGNTFTSITDMRTWLSNQSANTPETAYNVRLNVNTVPQYMRNYFSDKYVNLDLSGSTMTSFPNYAFEASRTLISVILPNTVNSIPSELFKSCSGLTSVTIGSGVNSIGPNAFNGCSGLPTISIPNNVTSIGNYAFINCTGLKSISIGTSVTSIGIQAFRGCTGLLTVTIPSNVNNIDASAFYECTGLTSVTIEHGSIGNQAFQNCTGLTSVTIGTGVSIIGAQAFRGCTSLTTITFTPASTIYSIGSSAFQGCTNLPSVIIPNSVTTINTYAFNGCSALTSVTIGSSVNTIGSDAFTTPSLVTVTFLGNTVATLSSSAFNSGASLVTAYKAGGAGTYQKTGTTWSKSS